MKEIKSYTEHEGLQKCDKSRMWVGVGVCVCVNYIIYMLAVAILRYDQRQAKNKNLQGGDS